ncbi:kinesin [Lotmaria passim]
MPIDAVRDTRSGAFPVTTSNEDRDFCADDDALYENSDLANSHHSRGSNFTSAVPKLKSPPAVFMTSPPSSTSLRGATEGIATPNTSATALLSPVASPRELQRLLPQESVSVLVRLKGAPSSLGPLQAVGGGAVSAGERVLSAPNSLTASPRAPPPPLLEYTIEDGTLRTPRTGRRAAARNGGLLTPRPSLDTSVPVAATGASARSPLTSSPLTLTTAAAVALPKAITTAAAAAAAAAAATTTTATSALTTPAAQRVPGAATPGSPSQHPYSGSSGSIGCRGRVLSLKAPASDDVRQYEFGEVFDPEVTNADLCERLLPSIMEQFLANYNTCVLCYGQTGSGKTYTMNALAPAITYEVFRTLDVNNDVVEMSYIQIYNNKAYNLLDGPRAGKLGAKLSKPLQLTNTDINNCGGGNPTSASSGLANGAYEPKTLVRNAAEVLARMKTAARLRVTHAHALNPHSSRSFTLLTLHVTRFLDGAPLTTTRVTLADLAGTERLKKSGATGEGQSQAIFINKSLMALRELVEANNTEAEVRHFRDSLLTTYLAPRMRSWHLFLLVTASLEVNNYEETKSSLDFATNARRRRIKKVKSRTADRLTCSSWRSFASGSNGVGGDVVELRGVIEALQYRINALEEALKAAQLQRTALARLCTPVTSPPPDDDLSLERSRDAERETTREERLRQSELRIHQLCQECRQYRQLLHVREEELRSVQAQAPEGEAASAELTGSLLSPGLIGSCGGNANNTSYSSSSFSNHLQHHNPNHRCHSSLRDNGAVSDPAITSPQPPQLLLSSPSSLSASMLSGDAVAATAAAEEREAAGLSTNTINTTTTAAVSPVDGSEDVQTQLLHGVREFCTRLRSSNDHDADAHAALDRLLDMALRAKEESDDVRERLLVVTTSLAGLRAQCRQLHDAVLQARRDALSQDTRLARQRALLDQERARAAAAEVVVEELRLQLFRAYAEQPISEEVTRLYLGEQPALEPAVTLFGTQLAEHREEVEKFEAHQRALQDKITELVNTVEQLTRAGSQKDVSLAALETIITPAQRALFQTMSNTRNDNDGGGGAARHFVAAAATAGSTASTTTVSDPSSAADENVADCLSLLQSRVAELQALLLQERQQHQLTSCELIESREEARRSRQEQRQAFFQQQEEGRRVAQLTAENFDLRQQSERHQMYLDQIHVHFQEQLLELRRFHEAELAEQRRLFEEAQEQQQQQRSYAATHAPSAMRWAAMSDKEEAQESRDNNNDDDCGFRQTSTRCRTSHGQLPGSRDWTAEGATARGSAGPSSSRSAAEEQRTSFMTSPQSRRAFAARAQSRSAAAPSHTVTAVKKGGKQRESNGKKGHAKKTKGKAISGGRGRRSGTGASPASPASSRTHAFNEKGEGRTSAILNSMQPSTKAPRNLADPT